MKKFLAMLVVAAMLASLGVLCASADEAEGNTAWTGPFGEVTAKYVEDLSTKITLDGDVSDWQSGGFQKYEIDAANLDPWVGEVKEGWSIDMWFSADAEFMYIAFKINDPDVQYSADDKYDKDAFQIQLDFNGWAAKTEAFERAVFYSFGLQEDGTVDITVQCIADDAASSIDYTMASDDEESWRQGHVKGATKKADDGSGWYAEFAISWQTLYNDISKKLADNGEEVPEWHGGEDKVSLNMLVCYLDHQSNADGTDAGIVGAWGTSAALGSLGGKHETINGWYPESAGMILTLDGMEKVTIEETTAEPTEATTEEPTEATTEEQTEATTEAKTEATTEAKTEAKTEATTAAAESGCGGIIGAGALVRPILHHWQGEWSAKAFEATSSMLSSGSLPPFCQQE